MPLPFHDCLNQNVNFKQICVQLRSLAVNVTLPAFAAERRAAAGRLKMRDMKIRDGQNAGPENARHEFAAPVCRGRNCGT